jgi:hypothetical protein
MEGRDWIYVAQYAVKWRIFVNTEKKLSSS